ncbi:MAG TPA: hypothetical protein VGR69_07035 [Candidatus Rubrimentiphilum sp.]|nr:hypothetical protein [Candidatus Rubrimentiphilum sp.]
MRRDWFYTGLFIFCVVFLVAGTWVGIRNHWWGDFANKAEVSKVRQRPTVLYLSLTIKYDKPPIYQEQYVMQNNNGLSSAFYRIRAYSGKQVTILEPPRPAYEVTFFIEQIEQDGLWQLMSKPPRGNTDVHYTLYAHELINGMQGSRTILFTDPQYWAKTAGRQYQLHLSPNSPTPNLLTLKGTAIADPRYQQIVQAFRNFGPAAFRTKIAQAKTLVLR